MDELLGQVRGGAEIWSLIVAFASVLSVFLSDSKNPKVAKVVNWLALNVGKAKNAPN